MAKHDFVSGLNGRANAGGSKQSSLLLPSTPEKSDDRSGASTPIVPVGDDALEIQNSDAKSAVHAASDVPPAFTGLGAGSDDELVTEDNGSITGETSAGAKDDGRLNDGTGLSLASPSVGTPEIKEMKPFDAVDAPGATINPGASQYSAQASLGIGVASAQKLLNGSIFDNLNAITLPLPENIVPDERAWNGSGATATTVGLSGNALINGVLSGTKWAGNPGTPNVITYSAPDSLADYQAGYFVGFDTSNFSAFTTQQMQAFHFSLNTLGTASAGFSVSGFTGLTANFIGGGSGAGTIRGANLDDAWPTAYAYYPSNSIYGGDTFFSTRYDGTSLSYRTPVAGNYAWHTMIHEIGHSLGLKHGHTTRFWNDTDFPVLPTNYDSVEYSVMTYRSYVGHTLGGYSYEQWGAPQTYMIADIAALQHMYGADFTTNRGATVYKWDPNSGTTYVNGNAAITPGGNRIFATIWDGGGIDTYDLSAYKTSVLVDLRPGMYSVFSETQLAYLGGGPNNGYARGNIFNALQYNNDPRSLIENARGGSGNDTITGNAAENKLWGNGGDDALYGASGSDKLYGGTGSDQLYGGTGNDYLYGGTGGDRLFGGTGNDYLHGASGDDRLYGQAGNDHMVGGTGDDRLYGGTGDDRMLGGAGADYLYGGAGADKLYGQAGSDRLYGGASSDYLYGGSGNDYLYGGTGNDFLYGGAGSDRLVGGTGDDRLVGGAGTDRLYGEAGSDRLYGGAASDRLYGGNGDDLLYGGSGNDYLYGGAGDDRLYGGSGKDTAVFSGARADYVITTSNNVTIVRHLNGGADGTDRLYDINIITFSDQSVTL